MKPTELISIFVTGIKSLQWASRNLRKDKRYRRLSNIWYVHVDMRLYFKINIINFVSCFLNFYNTGIVK